MSETGSLGGGEATRETGEWPRSVPAGWSDVRRHLVIWTTREMRPGIVTEGILATDYGTEMDEGAE